jgi:hypothetical protein
LDTKSKFEEDQKNQNREAELALKHKKEEEEQPEASKNWRGIFSNSSMLRSNKLSRR